MQVKIQKLDPKAELPRYATLGAACADLVALEGAFVPPGGSAAIRTGLAFDIPEGHVMLIFSRSGHGFVNDVRLANCVGVIDSDYRGEVMVKLTCDGGSYKVAAGDRIAQAMVIPIPQVTFVVGEELIQTARGAGGFGSTGK
jgi:dUTP pyrophosphatase